MTKSIGAEANTLVPAFLVLEELGFSVSRIEIAGQPSYRATRGDEAYLADDPLSLLGLVRLVEVRGWEWQASDAELERVFREYLSP